MFKQYLVTIVIILKEVTNLKNKEEQLALKRYKIIKPYLSKEKSLKTISEESELSYSTLKRWASAFKKNGLEGLKKSERSDKTTYRTLNDQTMDFIKELYKEDPNLKIYDYYKKILDFLKDIGAKTVSYDTIYRVINQLDPYIKDFNEEGLYSAKSPYEIFELEHFQIDYFLVDERDGSLKKPYLYIIYDSFSQIVSTFLLSFDKISLFDAMSLLREAILLSKRENFYIKPREYVINNQKFTDKTILKKIEKTSGISLSFSFNSSNKLEDFFDAYNKHYLRLIFFSADSEISLNKLHKLTQIYVDKNFGKFKEDITLALPKKLKKLNSENDLDSLLTPYSSKRKVKDSSIRFQNLIYFNKVLYKYEDLELEVRYNPLDLSKIKVYDHGFFVCELKSETLNGYTLSYYELQCIKKNLKIKLLNSVINLKEYAEEFKKILETKYKG